MVLKTVIAPKIWCEPPSQPSPQGERTIIVLPYGEDLGGVSSLNCHVLKYVYQNLLISCIVNS